MKFRNIVLLFIIVAILAAWYTKPTTEDFKKFMESKRTMGTPPVIEGKDSYVYGFYTVTYFNIKKVPEVKVSGEEAAIAVPASKEKYLALFGKFWKID